MPAKKIVKPTADKPVFNNNFVIEQITVDKDLQARATMNQDAIGDYKDAIIEGIDLPPMDLFTDGTTYWLVDGFHRLQAYKKIGILEVPVTIHAGTKNEAIMYAIGANKTHGLRRSNLDKKRAVEMAFSLMKALKKNWTDVYIAEIVGVSSMFIGNYRRENDPASIAAARETGTGRTVAGSSKAAPALPKFKEVSPTDEDTDVDNLEEDGPIKANKPSGPVSSKYPIGLAMDKIATGTEKLQVGVTELFAIYPSQELLAQALGEKAGVAILFSKLRKQLNLIVDEFNGVDLPYEVGD